MKAAFFDMDRTLVRVNTGRLYIRWRFERGEASWRDAARYSVWIAQYTLGVIDPTSVTRRAVRTLAGVREETFRDEIGLFFEQKVVPHISRDARREVERCRREGYHLVILSASTPYATQPLADELCIDHVLCSELEVRDGAFTGTCASLCYGHGKVRAAERWAREHDVDLDESLFFSDSTSDLPMLERVGRPFCINPDPRLRLQAWRRSWPIRTWT